MPNKLNPQDTDAAACTVRAMDMEQLTTQNKSFRMHAGKGYHWMKSLGPQQPLLAQKMLQMSESSRQVPVGCSASRNDSDADPIILYNKKSEVAFRSNKHRLRKCASKCGAAEYFLLKGGAANNLAANGYLNQEIR